MFCIWDDGRSDFSGVGNRCNLAFSCCRLFFFARFVKEGA